MHSYPQSFAFSNGSTRVSLPITLCNVLKGDWRLILLTQSFVGFLSLFNAPFHKSLKQLPLFLSVPL